MDIYCFCNKKKLPHSSFKQPGTSKYSHQLGELVTNDMFQNYLFWKAFRLRLSQIVWCRMKLKNKSMFILISLNTNLSCYHADRISHHIWGKKKNFFVRTVLVKVPSQHQCVTSHLISQTNFHDILNSSMMCLCDRFVIKFELEICMSDG